ncbi:helix-turn-helix domain-containing protein [Glutamicibacter arilaitensis]|uniref:helix-turn-helix domain-containing protein n=1 Tax=Glutamicibacter arilaitensis TaxID=256701 RepID=UPI003FD19DFD
MPTSENRKRKPIAQGPSGRAVAENLARIRRRVNMTAGELVATMERAGYKLPRTAISDIENGYRRVNADDIMALSVALNVNPNALLLPSTADSHLVGDEITGAVPETSGKDAWAWGDGFRALPLGEPFESQDGKEKMTAQEMAHLQARQDSWLRSAARPEDENQDVREFLVSVAEKLEALEPGERLTVWAHSPSDDSPAFNVLEYPPFTFTGSAAVEMERHTKQLLAGILREPSNAHYLESVLEELRNNGDD